MDSNVLLLEIGSVALGDLSEIEKDAILALYTNAEVRLAGMKTFELLRKKFQPNYRMGRTYEDLSRKYEWYDQLYKEYASSTAAGELGSDDFTDVETIDRYKFNSDAN